MVAVIVSLASEKVKPTHVGEGQRQHLGKFAFINSSTICQGFDLTFIAKPAKEWDGNDNYEAFKSLVNGFSPLNDAAERAVKFASDFNGAITRDEDEHKGML